MSLKELQLPSIASLRAIAALKNPHLALVRPARIGLGFESSGANQKTLAEIEEVLGGPGRLSLPYSLRWLLDVLAGLGVLHRTLGFVHGEVQPQHVVLGDDGVGRLIPVVRAHWVRGEERAPERLYYLAPEKLLGDRVDVRADVFSAGVMLWEALAGQRLLEAYTVEDIIARLMGGGIPAARAPEGEAWTVPLSAIAERALSIDPARRFSNVAEMKAAIEGACQRYLASPPGMAELFRDPLRRARGDIRESLAPESQRVTLPPDQPLPRSSLTPSTEAGVEAAAERLSRTSLFPFDLEEELTTKPNKPNRPSAAAPPVAQPKPHVNTLLGVPPPADRNSEPPAPDSITLPARRSIATAPPVVIPNTPPSATEPPPPPLPFGKTRTQFDLPEPTRPEQRSRTPMPAAAGAAPRATEPAAIRGVSPAVNVPEPSFELVRTRKRHGALWLALGAVAAIGLLAARPWLARQLAAATGAGLENPTPRADVTSPATPAGPSLTAAPAASATAAPLVGIASTPPAPVATAPANSPAASPRGQHVVVDDRVEPSVSPAPPSSPAPTAEPEPAAEPPAPPPPPPPPPAPKPKPAPVSDGDRYGI